MGQTPILSPVQMFQSHVVSCTQGCKWEYKEITRIEVRCPVGKLLLERAKKEEPETNPFKPRFFPFVPKMFEKILAKVKGQWIEARVIDKSVAANGRSVGYECETSGGNRFYVNRYHVKRIQVSVEAVPKNMAGT